MSSNSKDALGRQHASKLIKQRERQRAIAAAQTQKATTLDDNKIDQQHNRKVVRYNNEDFDTLVKTDNSNSPNSEYSNNSNNRAKSAERQTYGLNLTLLRKWQKERTQKLLDQEFAKQEIAVAKVRSFLDAIHSIVHIQSWYRMLKPRHRFNARKRAQLAVKYSYFRGIKLHWKSEKMFRVQIFGKFYIAWRDETRLSKDMQKVILEFFKSCIEKVRLTPQACMAFFNQEKWSRAIPKADMLKIRRLMLQKLFYGWRAETRDLSIMRYKAAQVLSRMVRRTKGPLWVKESALVCFHMWYRYISVKKAYRLELPDPRYNNPFLPQWTKLFKDITVSRIKKKRTHELGKFLTQLRCYKRWRAIMAMDRSKPITPLAVAIMHYSTVLLRKVVTEWSELLKERGKIARFRDKIFFRWKKWAPHHRNMRLFQAKAIALIKFKQMENAYKIMVKICFNVIGKRTEKIKELRRNFCDRRVVLCAYALMHKNSHLMMVDCWRKLWLYWKSRKNWKALNWRLTYSWHIQRSKVLFDHWKEFLVMIKAERAPPPTPVVLLAPSLEDMKKELVDIVPEDFEKKRKKPVMLSGSLSESDEESSDDDKFSSNTNSFLIDNADATVLPIHRSARNVSILKKTLNIRNKTSPITATTSTVTVSSNDKLNTSNNTEVMDSKVPHNDNNKNNTTQQRRGAQAMIIEPDRDRLVRGFGCIAMELMKDGSTGKLISTFEQHPFQIFCLASVKAYQELMAISNTDKTKAQSFMGYQDNLQLGIDQTNLGIVMKAISDGAIVLPSHVRQVCRHIGDQYIPIFVLLLLNSMLFFAERMVKEDIDSVLNNIINPINAYLVATQLDRWKKIELTVRETSNISQNANIHNYITTPCTSKYIWRVLVWQIVDRKSKILAKSCKELPIQHSIEEEVAEIYKRQKLTKLYELRNLLYSLINTHDDQVSESNNNSKELQENVNDVIPPLIKTNDIETSLNLKELPNINSQSNKESTESSSLHKDIYTVLREYTLLTGRLANEVKALRLPLMERDEQLIINGFLKQSHSDYLELRKQCMTEKQKAEENAKKKKKRPKSSSKRRKTKTTDKLLKGSKGKNKIQDIFNALLKEDLDQPFDMNINEDEEDYSTGNATTDAETSGEEDQENISTDKAKKLLRSALRKYSLLIFLQEDMQEEEDLKREIEFQQRTSVLLNSNSNNNDRTPVLIEIWQPKTWQLFLNDTQAQLVKSLFGQWIIAASQSVIMRIFVLLSSDPTIASFPEYNSVRTDPKIGSYGMWLINHVLEHTESLTSPTWAILPQDYWSFEFISDKFSVELACIAGTISGIKSSLDENLNTNNMIDKNLTTYQKFLKTTRKYIMDVSEKRFSKHDADKMERLPIIAKKKKLEINIKNKSFLLQSLQEKIASAKVQVATGNLNAAASLFIKPSIENEILESTVSGKKSNTSPAKNKTVSPVTKGGKKNIKEVTEVVEINYDYKAVHEFMTEAQNEIDRMKIEIEELETRKKEGENMIRIFDWQCQRTTRMLRDLAAGHFETMVDVQAIAIRENARLKDSEKKTSVEIKRIRSVLRYQNAINNFIAGNLENRKIQLKREAEQKRISNLLYRKNTNSDFAKLGINNINNESIGASSVLSNENNISSNFENPESVSSGLEPSKLVKPSKLKQKILSSIIAPTLSSTVKLMQTVESPPKTLTVDEELALAHYNSAENVKKREDELKRLAEEQAQELIANDLRLRLFDEYWSSLPNNLHRERIYTNDNEEDKIDQQQIKNEEPQINIPKLIRNRTEKIWASIGKQYWRTKEHFIRKMVSEGEEDLLLKIGQALRPIDPLDEMIKESPLHRKLKSKETMSGYNDDLDDDGNMSIGGLSLRSIPNNEHNLHAMQVQLFTEMMSEQVTGDIWKSTTSPEYMKMISVSMKQFQNEINASTPLEPSKSSSRALSRVATASSGLDLLQPASRAPSRAATASSGLDLLLEESEVGSLDSSKPKIDPFTAIGKGEYTKFQFGMFSKAVSSVGGDSGGQAGMENDSVSVESLFTGLDNNSTADKEEEDAFHQPDENFDATSQTSSALHSIQVKQYLDLIEESVHHSEPLLMNNHNNDDQYFDDLNQEEVSQEEVEDDQYLAKEEEKKEEESSLVNQNALVDLAVNAQQTETDTVSSLDKILMNTNETMINKNQSPLIAEETASITTSLHSEALSKSSRRSVRRDPNLKFDDEDQLVVTVTSPSDVDSIYLNVKAPNLATTIPSNILKAHEEYRINSDTNNTEYIPSKDGNDDISVTSDVSMDQDLQLLGSTKAKSTKTNHSNNAKVYLRPVDAVPKYNSRKQTTIMNGTENTSKLYKSNVNENLIAVTIGGQWYMQPSHVTESHNERTIPPSAQSIKNYTSTIANDISITTNTPLKTHLELSGKKLSMNTRPTTPLQQLNGIVEYPADTAAAASTLMNEQQRHIATPHRLAAELGLGLEDSIINGIYSEPSEDLQNLVKEFSIEREREELKRLKIEEQSRLSFFPPNFRQSKIKILPSEEEVSKNKDMHLILNSFLEDSCPSPTNNLLGQKISGSQNSKPKKVEFMEISDNVNNDEDPASVNIVSGTKVTLSSKMKYMLNHKDLYNPNELRLELQNNILSADLPSEKSSVIETATIAATEIRRYMNSRELKSRKHPADGTLSKLTSLSDNFKVAIKLRDDVATEVKMMPKTSAHNDIPRQVTTIVNNDLTTIYDKDGRVIERSSSPNFWVDVAKKMPSIEKQEINSSKPEILIIDDSITGVETDENQSLLKEFQYILEDNEITNTIKDPILLLPMNPNLSSLEESLGSSSIFGDTNSIDIDDPANLTRLSHHDLNGRNTSPLNSNRFGLHHSPLKIALKAKKLKHPVREVFKNNEQLYRPRTPIKSVMKTNKPNTASADLDLSGIISIANNNHYVKVPSNNIINKKNKIIMNSKSDGELLKQSKAMSMNIDDSVNKNHSYNNVVDDMGFDEDHHHLTTPETRKILEEIAKVEYPYFSNDFLESKNALINAIDEPPILNLNIPTKLREPPIPPQYLTTLSSSSAFDNQGNDKTPHISNTASHNPNHINIQFTPKDNDIKLNEIINKSNIVSKQQSNKSKHPTVILQKEFKAQELNDLIHINNHNTLSNTKLLANKPIKKIQVSEIPQGNQHDLVHSQFTADTISITNNNNTNIIDDEEDIERELRSILEEEHRKDDQEAYRKYYFETHKQHLHQHFEQGIIPFKVGGAHGNTHPLSPMGSSSKPTNLFPMGVFGGASKSHLYKGNVSNTAGNSFLPPIDSSKNNEKAINETLFTQKLFSKTNTSTVISPAARLLQEYLHKTIPPSSNNSIGNELNTISYHSVTDHINKQNSNTSNSTNNLRNDSITSIGSSDSIHSSKLQNDENMSFISIPSVEIKRNPNINSSNDSVNSTGSKTSISNSEIPIKSQSVEFWKLGELDITNNLFKGGDPLHNKKRRKEKKMKKTN